MSKRSRRVRSIPIAMALAGACLFAQIPPIILQNNQDSLVFVHSERRQNNGLGSPEVSYGTGFLVQAGVTS